MTRPNLDDPAERAAYRRELVNLHRRWRWLGLAMLALALAIMVARGGGFDAWTLGLLAIGWAILIGVVVQRTRYHRRRMRGG